MAATHKEVSRLCAETTRRLNPPRASRLSRAVSSGGSHCHKDPINGYDLSGMTPYGRGRCDSMHSSTPWVDKNHAPCNVDARIHQYCRQRANASNAFCHSVRVVEIVTPAQMRPSKLKLACRASTLIGGKLRWSIISDVVALLVCPEDAR